MPENQTQSQESETMSTEELMNQIFGSAGEGPWGAPVESDTPPANEEASQVDTAIPPQPTPAQEKPVDNDAVRYQYWQSQAAQKEQELAKLRAELESAKAATNGEEEDEGFPDPPQKPRPPYGFNQEDAATNPSSPSAQYMREYQQWEEVMQEYSTLRMQYLEARIMEQEERYQKREQEALARQQAEMQRAQQQAAFQQHVIATHGADPKTAEDFIRWASDPNNLTIDNLYKFYTVAQGKAPVAAPTQAFNQAANAANFAPSPTSLPSGAASERSNFDMFMDEIIQKDNNRNKW